MMGVWISGYDWLNTFEFEQKFKGTLRVWTHASPENVVPLPPINIVTWELEGIPQVDSYQNLTFRLNHVLKFRT